MHCTPVLTWRCSCSCACAQIELAANFTMLGTPVDMHHTNPRLKYYNETLFFQAR